MRIPSFFLIDCLIELERYQEAEEALVRFSDLRGKSLTYHMLYGLLKMRTNRQEEANKEFEKACSIEPRRKDYWIFRMTARLFMAGNLLAMGKLDEAKKQARLAGREVMEPELFIKALDNIASNVIRYEALSECVRIGRIKRTPEFMEFLEEMRFSAELEADLLGLQDGEDNL